MNLQSILRAVTKDQTLNNIAQSTGQSPDTVQEIIKTGLPLIVGQMAQNTSTKSGEQSLNKALDQHSDSSVLDTLGGLFGSSDSNNDGLSILGHIFGNNNEKAASNISRKTGVDAATVMNVLSFIAPLVMAYMAQKKTSGGIKDTVQGAKDDNGNPLIDIVGSVLDGSSGKNSGGILGTILGGLFGGNSSKKGTGSTNGGLLESILGSLFKKK